MSGLHRLFGQQLPQLVMFDLDGTLVDSVADMAAAVDVMLLQLGRPAAGVAKVRDWVGNGSEVLVRRALSDGETAAQDAAQVGEALALFMAAYTGRQGLTQVYPGVLEALAWLKARGVKLAVVTNKPQRFIQPLLQDKGLDTYMDCWVGGDSLPTKKPEPGPLLYVLDLYKVGAERALFVGDSRTDVLAARAAKVPCVAVSYGYNHGRPVAEEGADLLVDDLRELLPRGAL